MDPFRTQGAFSWNELTTPEPAAAAEFYGRLFGWTIETSNIGTGPYRVLRVGRIAVGGIVGPPPGSKAGAPAWRGYVTVDDLDAVLATCTQLGGRVLAQPMVVPGVGRMAVIQDPQGAVLNVACYAAVE
jgi:predicted enzyme related to lactoylglutathione lyase